MFKNLVWRLMRRYKLFCLIGILIFSVQVFLAYKSLGISDFNAPASSNSILTSQAVDQLSNIALQAQFKQSGGSFSKVSAAVAGSQNSASDDDDSPPLPLQSTSIQQIKRAADDEIRTGLNVKHLDFEPDCLIASKEAISALQRAKTKDCRKHIAHVACAIQAGHFYAQTLPNYCPTGNHTPNLELGCYRDEKDFRLLSGYFINFKTSNTPQRCIELCLQSGFPYAGVQYGTECFCGNEKPVTASKLPDSSCNIKCSGDVKEVCGGFFSMNIYETGVAKFTAKIAETSIETDTDSVRIAFLLTLNGRAVRQIYRLLKALYSPSHVFYIHVDARQDYLYRQLIALESEFSNIRLARKRHSTIWGGASLLTMLMQCMDDLLTETEWKWDFVINLSESDFPVKTMDKLVKFLTANRDRNFVKSHGRETQRFIQKQGLDKTFVECDTHMWRIGDRRLPSGVQIDGGSDWIALSRPFVHYLISHSTTDPLISGLLVVFRHTLLPAESFFHTVLRNSQFCDTYVDNNLHVTNWKRKLGCKCQYKHVVDWCGCSPNDFKTEDWSRLLGTEQKMLFFARKFEPIINQAILLQLEEWLFGPYTSEYVNLHAYWQSIYHRNDVPSKADDLTLTIGESLIRIISRQLGLDSKDGAGLIELTHYFHQDTYRGFLVRFMTNNDTDELETRVRPVQYGKVAKNSKFAKRLRNFEISSDFDQKEQVSRNFAKILGPFTQPILSFTFTGAGASSTHNDGAAHSYNLTLLWINPAGNLEDYTELHIEDNVNDVIHFSKAVIKQPLIPGIWTVKLIGRAGIYAQTKFLISPLAHESGKSITSRDRAKIVNGGVKNQKQRNMMSFDSEIPNEWKQHLPTSHDRMVLQRLVEENAQRTANSLHDWIDELIGKFFHFRETCFINEFSLKLSTAAANVIPQCKNTLWSSLAPDPKSDVKSLLKRR